MKVAKTTFAEHENKHKNKCSSCALHIALFSINFTTDVGTGTYFVYNKYINHWYLKKDVTRVKCGTFTQTTV